MFLLHYMIWGLPTAVLETRRQSARVWCEPLAAGWWLVAALELGQTLADAAGHGSSAGIDRVLWARDAVISHNGALRRTFPCEGS